MVTKKHLARAERERIQTRWIVTGTIATAALVVGVLAYGWIRTEVIEPGQPVATVNGEQITTRQFQGQVRLSRYSLINNFQSMQQMYSWFASDPNLQAMVEQRLTSIASQLADALSLGETVLDQMVDDLLIRKEAQRRGITVSQADVDQAIEADFGFYPNGTPTSAPTATLSPVEETEQATTPTVTPAPAPTATLSPVEETEQATTPTRPTATELPTGTPSATFTPGPSPTVTATSGPEPTATAYTRDAFEANYREQIDGLHTSAGVSEADFRAQIEASLYRSRLMQAFEAEVPREEEQVHAQHILVTDEATAEVVLNRLAAGDAWESLVTEFSTDTGTVEAAGDLGWFARGAMDPAFEAAAFSTPVGEVSPPVQSAYGWHIIEVLGHERRTLTASQFQQAAQAYFDEWLAGQRSTAEIVKFDIWEARVPTEPALSISAGQSN
jgi:parvulin-like peptidyl-prolyl isomerase